MAKGQTHNIFISYAHQDATWRDRFLTHFAPVRTCGLIDVWTDIKIQASENRREKIEKALDEADIVLFR